MFNMQVSVSKCDFCVALTPVLNRYSEGHKSFFQTRACLKPGMLFLSAFLLYVVGSKSFRPDIQKPRQMENAVRDI